MGPFEWVDSNFDDSISKMTEEELLQNYQDTNDKQYIHEYISRLLLYKTTEKNLENILLEELFGRKIIDIIIQDKLTIDYYSCITISKSPYLLEYFLTNGFIQVIENTRYNIYHIPIAGISLAEYLFKNNLINEYTITSILDCPDLLKYIKQYHKEDLIKVLDPMYFLTTRNGKILLDELIELEIDCELGEIFEMVVIKEIIKREKYHLLSNISRYAALYKLEDNKTIFEFLLEKDVECKHVLSNLDREDLINAEVMDILTKYNRLDMLQNIKERALIANRKNTDKTILEVLLDNGMEPNLDVIKEPRTLEILVKYNRYDLLTKASEAMLIERLASGKFLLEELLERNLSIEADPISYPELVSLIYKYQRKDLYINLSLESLLSYYGLDTTYLDLILEEQKDDPSIKIKDINPDIAYISLSQIYLIYIKHGYNINLTAEQLLKDDLGMTLLEYMFQFDKKTTLEKVITPELLQDPNIEMLVKVVNMEDDLTTLSPVIDEARNNYLDDIINRNKSIKLTEEQQQLIDALIQLMDDGKSDKEALEMLEIIYKKLLATNSEYKDEIIRFIELKQNNPEASVQISNAGSCYCPPAKAVSIDMKVFSTLRHEIGHMLYDLLSEEPIPQELENHIIHLRLSNSFKQSAKQFALYHTRLKERIERYVEETYMYKYDESITQEKRDEIARYIETVQKSETILRGVIPDYYQITVDDFIQKDREIRKNMMVDAILRTKFGHVLAISDIFDAVYEGVYIEGRLEDENGKPIIGKFGHGSDYYSRGDRWIYDEIIANYSLISKDIDNPEAIAMFKKYLGEELYVLVKRYYDKSILNSKKYTDKITL